MKTTIFRYISFVCFGTVLVACSTKKDKFINRNYHALTTKYNVMYNGGLALEAGIKDLSSSSVDNFWDVLPIERMQIIEPVFGQETPERNANFIRAEEKAIKAIQKHSMNIGGSEKNPQMDEAYLLLGKSRYYEQRFIPALEAFNYVLYKYTDSDKINEVKLWKEKVNLRLESYSLAIKNLKKLLSEDKLTEEIISDANATLAQAYLNENQNDSAIVALKKAYALAYNNELKARYQFILGQLYQKTNQSDSANAYFQRVIDMNRKSPRRYVLESYNRLTTLLSDKDQDTILFLKKYQDLLEDRENRPYLDILNHRMALYYEGKNNAAKAIEYYNKSLKTNSQDKYLVASNYRNLAEINFDAAKYSVAGKYYDSTLVNLQERTKEYRLIKKKRENLNDVIQYEAIAVANDSVLSLIKMSESERITYFEKYIDELKSKEALKQKQMNDQMQKMQEQSKDFSGDDDVTFKNFTDNSNKLDSKKNSLKSSPGMPPGVGGNSNVSSFYFYNSNTVAFGKTEFRKKWGDRVLKDNWRWSSMSNSISSDLNNDNNEFASVDDAKSQVVDQIDPRYTVTYYVEKIPTDVNKINEISKDRNFAYYQLGIIYKDKFKEYQLAQDKLEGLLNNKPEDRLVLPSMYNLYKVYELTKQNDKANILKENIIRLYPTSRYAQILANPNSINALEGTPDEIYKIAYKKFESGKYRELYLELDEIIDQFSAEDIVSKFELLKASVAAKLEGVTKYKEVLNYVSLTYPNSQEGKLAESLLNKDIPKLEKLYFTNNTETTYKLVFNIPDNNLERTKQLLDKLTLFSKDRAAEQLKITTDLYTTNKDLVVLHNIKTEQDAKDYVTLLVEYKDYKIKESPIIISTDNYKVVQIKKNLHDYIVADQKDFKPAEKLEIEKKEIDKKVVTPKAEQTKKQNTRKSVTDDDDPMDKGSNQELIQEKQQKSKQNSQRVNPNTSGGIGSERNSNQNQLLIPKR